MRVVQKFNIGKSLSKWTLFKDFESKLQFQAFNKKNNNLKKIFSRNLSKIQK